MKKSLLVITLLVIGCSFATAQTFSFWNSAGTIEYCNFNVLNFPTSGVAAGYDNTTTACFFAYNSPVVGFNATTPASSLPAHGKGIVVGDGLYDASADAFTGLQWTVWQSLTPSKKNKKTGQFSGKWGWVGVAGTYTGFYFGDNFGYLGAGYPAGNVASHGTTAGKSNRAIRK